MAERRLPQAKAWRSDDTASKASPNAPVHISSDLGRGECAPEIEQNRAAVRRATVL